MCLPIVPRSNYTCVLFAIPCCYGMMDSLVPGPQHPYEPPNPFPCLLSAGCGFAVSSARLHLRIEKKASLG